MRKEGAESTVQVVGERRGPGHPWRVGHAQRCPAVALGIRGGLLMEAVIAIAAFTIVGTSVLTGLSTTHISGAKTESQSIAENVGRNQMERVFSLPYQEPPSTYPSVATPPGYSVTAIADEYVPDDPAIEKVVVAVSQGEQNVLVLETLRVKE